MHFHKRILFVTFSIFAFILFFHNQKVHAEQSTTNDDQNQEEPSDNNTENESDANENPEDDPDSLNNEDMEDQEGEDISDEEAEVAKKIQEIEDQLNQTISENQSVINKLGDIEQQLQAKKEEINTTEQAIKDTEMKIKTIEESISQLNNQMNELEKDITNREEIIKNRLRSMQQNGGNVSYLEVLFGAEGFGDLISRITALTKLADKDKEIMEAHKIDVEKKIAKQAKLEEEKQLINKKREDLKQSDQQLIAKIQELDAIQASLKNEMFANNIEISQLVAKRSNLNNSEENKDNLTTLSTEESVVNPSTLARDEFMWPTIGGKITSHQGMRWGSFHDGIDIANPSDHSILAANGGMVIFSGWRNGYGRTIQIDHQNGYITQYAHLNSINVSIGDTVTKGEKIGVMGTTGRSSGVHLDFEVYYNGSVINPLDVLPER